MREEQRAITNSSKKNEVAGPKQKWCSVLDVFGGESKVQRCKEQYCTGTWNTGSMNQGKLDTLKQEDGKIDLQIEKPQNDVIYPWHHFTRPTKPNHKPGA